MPITTSRKAPVFENILVTEETFSEAIADLKSHPILAFDTETSGTKPELGDYIAGCSFSTPEKVSYYFPFHHVSPGGSEVWLLDEEGDEDPEPIYVKPGDTKREEKVAEWLAWYDGDQVFDPPHDISSVDEFPPAGELWPGNLPLKLFKQIMAIIARPNVPMVAHNTKFDILMAIWTARQWYPEAPPDKRRQWENAVLCADWHDTMVCAKNLDMDGWVGLKVIGEKIWPGANAAEKELVALMKRRGHSQKNPMYHNTRPEEAYVYACADTELCLRLCCDVQPKDVDRVGIGATYTQERKVMRTLSRMELKGIMVDTETNREQMEVCEELMVWALAQCHKIAGYEFNPNSEKQLEKAFNDCDIDIREFCQTTYYVEKLNQQKRKNNEKPVELCMRKEVLDELDHPLADAVCNYRHFSAFLSTFINPLPELSVTDGRVHTHYRQTKVVTGRFSSESPNLQNPPKRKYKLRGKRIHKKWQALNDRVNIRSQFVPAPGKVLLAPDYSQIEYRLMGCYTEDPLVVEAFMRGDDLHQATTDHINNFIGKEIIGRSEGKNCNFAQIYGVSPRGLCPMINQPLEVTERIIHAYHQVHPRVHEFTNDVRDAIKECGYVVNWYGVRYHLPLGLAYKGVNYLCQGGAAYMIKEKMAALQDYIDEHGLWNQVEMLLQIHDELVIEVDKDYVDEAVQWIVPIMEDFATDVPGLRDAFPLPIKVDMEVCPRSFGEKFQWKGSYAESIAQ